MDRTERVDVTVIGGGPAGLAAAAAAREAGARHVLLVEPDTRLGGILNQCIHDGFGTKVFNEALTGPEYAAIYEKKVRDAGVEVWLESTVTDVTRDRSVTICSPDGLSRVETGALVLAMGCRERARGAIGIPGTRPAGIFTAGAVQNYMNLKNVASIPQRTALGTPMK